MSMFGKSYKGKIAFDTDGKPTGVSGVETASILDGAIGGLTGLLDGGDTFVTGTAKTVGELTKVAIAAAVTSKITTDSFIPRKLG